MAPILQVIGAATVVLLPIIFDVATINIIMIIIIVIIIIGQTKPAYGRQGLVGGMMGPRYKRVLIFRDTQTDRHFIITYISSYCN